MSIFFASPQQDVGHGRSHNYETNSIILVGLKVPGTSMASFGVFQFHPFGCLHHLDHHHPHHPHHDQQHGKVLEAGSRTARSVEETWRSW